MREMFENKAQLVGSEKQVAWANDIRERAIEDMTFWVEDGGCKPEDIEAFEKLLQIPAATWWINNKSVANLAGFPTLFRWVRVPEYAPRLKEYMEVR